MNINLIKTALEKYLCTTENDNEKLACVEALKEIACTMEHKMNVDLNKASLEKDQGTTEDNNDAYDFWDNEAVLIPLAAWIDILDDMTYGIFTERMKQHGEYCRPADYYCDVRKKCCKLDQVATQYLECGFGILYDHWLDNKVNE